MKTYSIMYDLGNPGRNYNGVATRIKELANGHCRPTESQWLINSNSSASQIRDSIATMLDSGDKLMVHEVGNNWSTWGMTKSENDWLHQHWQSSCVIA